jgi:hypothetical protein
MPDPIPPGDGVEQPKDGGEDRKPELPKSPESTAAQPPTGPHDTSRGRQQEPVTDEVDLDEEIRKSYESLPQEQREVIEGAEADGELQQLLAYTLVPPGVHGVTNESEYKDFAQEVNRLKFELHDKAENNQALKDVFGKVPVQVPGSDKPVSVLNIVEVQVPEDISPQGERKNDKEAFAYEALSETFRQELKGKGIDENGTRLLYQYGKDPDAMSPQEKTVAESIIHAHPELKERITREMEHPIPTIAPDGTPLSEEEQRELKETQERIQKDKKELDEAIEAAKKHPLDVDKREEAAEAIRKAKDRHDKDAKHGAEALQKGDPTWAKLLKGLGIAFYIYIGLQYAAASAAEAYGKGSGGK